MTVYVHLPEHDQDSKDMQRKAATGIHSEMLDAMLIGRNAMTKRLAQMQADMEEPGTAMERDHGPIPMPESRLAPVRRQGNENGGSIQMAAAQTGANPAPDETKSPHRKPPKYGRQFGD